MKFFIKFNGFPSFVLQYEDKEWNLVEEKLISLCLTKSTTKNLWGSGIESNYYRETNKELLTILDRTFMKNLNFHEFKDDINSPFFEDGIINLAIFRVVPREDLKVEGRLGKFLTIAELNTLSYYLSKIYEILFNIATEKNVVSIQTVDHLQTKKEV